MTGSAPTPQAMTLEEALQVAKANAWDVMFEPDGFVGIARTDGKGGIAFAEGWVVAFSAALGYPVVERDDTAELVEALKQAHGALSFWASPADRLEASKRIETALAKWKERRE